MTKDDMMKMNLEESRIREVLKNGMPAEKYVQEYMGTMQFQDMLSGAKELMSR